jgi:FkbM family methyltransferase
VSIRLFAQQAIVVILSTLVGFKLSQLGMHKQAMSCPSAHPNDIVYGNALALCPGGMGTSNLHVEDLLWLQASGLTIDVGAHDGADAIAYAERGHTVLSFDPSPKKSALIRKRIQSSAFSSKITFKPIGLSDKEGVVDFFVSNDKGGVGSQQDMIDTPPFPYKHAFEKVQVSVDTLDNQIGNRTVLWLKIDAQGHDAHIVMGARKALSEKRIAALSFEVSPKLAKDPQDYVNAVTFLNDVGYVCHDCRFFKYGLRGKTSHVQWAGVKQLLKGMVDASHTDTGKYTEFVCYLRAHI